MLRILLAGLLVLWVSTAAWAVRVPAPDPRQGDGRVSAFYTWTDEIPAKPGEMLRTEPLDRTFGLPEAGQQFRILYSSTDGIDGKTPTVVSGMVFIPGGTPPAGGWPLIAWAHGTTGIADICAPSWAAMSYRDMEYLTTWLRQGYAIVATDYQGLGTPGPHPYLAVRPEAYSVLDSIRAVQSRLPELAKRVVIVGQSQGAGAAFATAGLAPDYAPDLDIRGTVATGIPFITPAVLHPPPAEVRLAEIGHPQPTFAYNLYIALLMEQHDPGLTTSQLVTKAAAPLLDLARTSCVTRLFSDVSAARMNRAEGLASTYASAFELILPELEYTTFKLRQPVFIGTGTEDHDVPPKGQLALVEKACAAGSTVEAHLYAGLNHGQTVNASLKDSLPFVRKVFAGEPITPVCDPKAE